MSKKNSNKFDSLDKLKTNKIYKNGEMGIYCNNCGGVHDGDHKECPKCGSEKIIYVRGDNE